MTEADFIHHQLLGPVHPPPPDPNYTFIARLDQYDVYIHCRSGTFVVWHGLNYHPIADTIWHAAMQIRDDYLQLRPTSVNP